MTDIRWNIESMYPDEASCATDMERMHAGSEKLKKLSANPDGHLKEILETVEEVSRIGEHLAVYANMRQDEDSRKTQYQKLYIESMQAMRDFQAASSFLQPYLLGLSDDRQQALLRDDSLAHFHEYFQRIFRYKEHTLSEKEEYILSKLSFASEAPSDIYYFLENADMKFPKIDSLDGKELTSEMFTVYQRHPNVEVRKETFEKYYDTFNSFKNTIATTYFNNIRALTTEADLRGYDSARQMELFRDDVDTQVYDALLESIHNNLPSLHRYYELKKKMLKLDEQHMYDVYLPIVESSGRKYTFEEARDLCIASVAPLGEEYQRIYRTAFEEGWIDAYPREGKRGGAYSSGSYDSKPFISMNFTGTLDSVFTLAHEMGHSMHSYFSRHANEYLYADYTIFAAEVASTFNENLLLHYLIENAQTDSERLELLDHHLDSFKSTVFRQTMFAEFEKVTHDLVEKGTALTAKDFDDIYYGLNQQYFGEAMISDENIAHEWMRIPHFYNDFYVYKYATGYCAATVLCQRVLTGGVQEREDYFRFLRDGAHHFPIEQLRMAGCDMADPKTVDSALRVFAQLVERLAQWADA
ncbi:MAG: oligoendopeptidase F [Ndongobacter sp.]|nr:oligoendopeptidase F [Ndongobacter sp.]